MKEPIKIKISYNGEIKEAELISGKYFLEFKYQDIYFKKDHVGRSPFFLLQEIRRELEPYNIYILFVGCRYDVWARGMHSCYLFKHGAPAQPGDRVRVFEPVEEPDMDKIKTVKDQEDYYRAWCNFFRQKYDARVKANNDTNWFQKVKHLFCFE